MTRNSVKKQTEEIHRYVETLPIMRDIIDSKITPQRYIDYMAQILKIYTTIESSSCFKQLDLDIRLTDLCEKDITSLENKYGIKRAPPFRMTQIYCSYLESLTDLDSMTAHVYVRYMADLSGGLVIKKRLPEDWASDVYVYDADTKKRIVELVDSVTSPKLFCAEVNHAFSVYAAVLIQC